MPIDPSLVAAVVLLVLAAAVITRRVGRRRGGGQRAGTCQLVARGDGTATAVCDLCSAFSPASSSRPLLTDWAHRHAATYHPDHAHLHR